MDRIKQAFFRINITTKREGVLREGCPSDIAHSSICFGMGHILSASRMVSWSFEGKARSRTKREKLVLQGFGFLVVLAAAHKPVFTKT